KEEDDSSLPDEPDLSEKQPTISDETPAPEPWQLTRGDFHKQAKQQPDYDPYQTSQAHKAAVAQALQEGKDVPPGALVDYPDLQPVKSVKEAVEEVLAPAQTTVKPGYNRTVMAVEIAFAMGSGRANLEAEQAVYEVLGIDAHRDVGPALRKADD